MAVKWTRLGDSVHSCEYVGDSKHRHGRACIGLICGKWTVAYDGIFVEHSAKTIVEAKTLAARYVVGCLKLKEGQ